MTDITRIVSWNVRQRLTNRKLTIVTFFAARRQFTEHAADMTGFTVQLTMVAVEQKAGNGMVESGSGNTVVTGGGRQQGIGKYQEGENPEYP